MLISLNYTTTFTATGRTLEQSIIFQKGLGTITGSNESGKSFVIEMIRFCLFGTAALRGVMADYKKLEATLVFQLVGDTYKIERTANSAKIYRDKDEIAVGVRPVNNKVVELLGFGMDVFDMSCVANQDELLKLGALGPADRKRMVDSVIGLSVLDDLAKTAADEATTLRRRAEDLDASLREPIPPIKPDDYIHSGLLKDQVEVLRGIKVSYDRLLGRLSIKRDEPVQPTCDVTETAAELNTLLATQQERQNLEQQINRLPSPSPYTEDQLTAFEVLAKRDDFLQAHPKPPVPLSDLQAYDDQWDVISWWKHYDLRMAKGEHECPSCHHTWPVEADEIKAMGECPAERPETEPSLSSTEVARHIHLWEIFGPYEKTYEDMVRIPGKAVLTVLEIAQARRQNIEAGERAALEQRLFALPEVADGVRAKYEARIRYDQAAEAYIETEREYTKWLASYREDEERTRNLEPEVAKLAPMETQLAEARAYEQALTHYTEVLETYNETKKLVEDLAAEAEDWKKVRAALTTLRGMVKQHLVPSLNVVASSLITQMTGGQRQSVVVDEDFNIEIDGQSIDTLSGSGKAVANLALRLGLGQVLTNNVLSLFIGDEIDGSMDQHRAENTTKTLGVLGRNISQILLVTHKYPEADYNISMDNNSEQTRK